MAGPLHLDRSGQLILDRTGQPAKSRTQSALYAIYRDLPLEALPPIFALLGTEGWRLAWLGHDALISRARSALVSRWYQEHNGDDVFLMIDADILYTLEDAERIVAKARETRGIVGANYPTRDGEHWAFSLPPGVRVSFVPEAPLVPVSWVATGFMAVHRDVITALTRTMPECEAAWLGKFWYLFLPEVWDSPDVGPVALSEDYAFCRRASLAGFPVDMDPGIILGHIGSKTYTIADIPGVERVPDAEPGPELVRSSR